jgi:hypothetical protein
MRAEIAAHSTMHTSMSTTLKAISQTATELVPIRISMVVGVKNGMNEITLNQTSLAADAAAKQRI